MKTLLPLLLLFAAVSVSVAQSEPKKQESTGAQAESSPKTAYRLDFKIFHLEGTKRINEREFMVMANASEHDSSPSSLRIGTRVPITSQGEKPNYLDVGFNVWARLVQQAGKLVASIRMEMTSLVLPEQGTEPHGSAPPVLRNGSFSLDTILVPGKAQLLSNMDDVNSNKRIQVEVVATKLE